MQSPKRAPDTQLYRFVTALDAAFTDPSLGVNGGDYKWLNFTVVPVNVAKRPLKDDFSAVGLAATTNPSVRVRFWNPYLKLWVKQNPDLSFTGLGAGLPYEFAVQSNGRDVMIELEGNAAATEGVAVFCSAFPEQY